MIALKKIAEIYTGFTIRESIDFLDDGEIKILQIKDLPKENAFVDHRELAKIEWKYDSKPQFLQHNSIVVVARGEAKAYLFQGDDSDQVVVSNQFIVVNLKTQLLAPEFLTWYFNQSQIMKNYFAMNSRGTLLSMLSISSLKDAPIVIPARAQQEEILALERRTVKEAAIYQRMIMLREEYNQAYSGRILKQAETQA